MDDLISRQMAKYTLAEKVFHSFTDEFYGTMQVLDELPPVQQWIPCSEKLPDEYDEYQVTWTTSASPRPFISNIEYTESGWICDVYMMYYPDITITAWMPLPEPYMGENNGLFSQNI